MLRNVSQLAVIQVGGAIGNAIVVKNAETFSLIPEKGFRMAAGVRLYPSMKQHMFNTHLNRYGPLEAQHVMW